MSTSLSACCGDWRGDGRGSRRSGGLRSEPRDTTDCAGDLARTEEGAAPRRDLDLDRPRRPCLPTKLWRFALNVDPSSPSMSST
eukprot:6738122-Pyramimonas_sp.AAC.1